MMAWYKLVHGWWSPVVLHLVSFVVVATAEFSVDPLFLTQPPKLVVSRVGPTWEKVETTHTLSALGNSSWFSAKGNDFFITCEAPYPIQWNINGFISPPEIVKIISPTRNLLENQFTLKLNVFFLDAQNFSELAASAKISCEQVGNPRVRDEVAVYVRGNRAETLQGPKSTVFDSNNITLIPCPTTDPRDVPSLYLRKNRGKSVETLVQNVVYTPTEGFRYTSGGIFAGGAYVCRQGTQWVTFDVPTFVNDFQFAPVSNQVRAFTDEWITLECSSDSKKSVQIVTELSGGITSEQVKDLAFSKVVRLGHSSYPASDIVLGKSVCVDENNKPIKKWSWMFIPPPTFFLDNIEGEVDCLSPFTPKSVQTVRCKNSMDCAFMEAQCLGNKTLCNFKKQKQFFTDFETFCSITEQRAENCVSVPFSHLNGVAKCEVMGLERHWQYFVSLDYSRYVNWKDAPENELIRIETVSEDNSPKPAKYICIATAFLFADNLAFRLNYKNGKIKLIQKSESLDKYDQPMYIEEFRVAATLEAEKIESGVVSIDCIAAFWNSTDVLTTTRLTNTNGKRMSKLVAANNMIAMPLESNPYTEESSENFYIGEKRKRLNCTVKEELETDETVTWLYRHKAVDPYEEILSVYPELVASDANGSNPATLYLEFPVVEKKHIGTYHCVRQRNDSTQVEERTILMTYMLDVTAEPLETSTTVYVGITILGMVIVGLVIAAFLVLIQKRSIKR